MLAWLPGSLQHGCRPREEGGARGRRRRGARARRARRTRRSASATRSRALRTLPSDYQLVVHLRLVEGTRSTTLRARWAALWAPARC
jgi:hypothetical protein